MRKHVKRGKRELRGLWEPYGFDVIPSEKHKRRPRKKRMTEESM